MKSLFCCHWSIKKEVNKQVRVKAEMMLYLVGNLLKNNKIYFVVSLKTNQYLLKNKKTMMDEVNQQIQIL